MSLAEACRNLRAASHRSILALLGVLIGSASIMAMVDIGAMSKAQSERQFAALGTNLLLIQPSFENAQSQAIAWNDVDALPTAGFELDVIAPYIMFNAAVGQGQAQQDTMILGTTSGFLRAAAMGLDAGRFISRFDGYEDFAVLGSLLARQLGQDGAPIAVGSKIRIGAEQFVVIGILQPSVQPPLVAANIAATALIPIKAMARLSPNDQITSIIARVGGGTPPAVVGERIVRWYHVRHPNQSIGIHTAEDLIATANGQLAIYSVMLAAVATISMLVGGAGVMNVMLVAVAERRSEIGIRLAVGARRRDIRTLFLLEATVLSFVGGGAGTAVGILAAWSLAQFAQWPFGVSVWALVLSLLSAAGVGLIAGVLPAMRAAHLDPIDALRHG